MPEHVATVVVIAIRSLTAVGAADGKDKYIRMVVARQAVVSGDEAVSVPTIAFSVASRVIIGMSVLFVPNKDHLYHP